ncbi:AI-2E family transporter [Umezawaea sp.]|uniref:AI-2E family transporter n=1 Tax=Umezawaea sp. TaxID=1955258 RepID=UPI002ED320C1
MSDSADGAASRAHHDLVAQPHERDDEGPIADAEAEAERMRSDERPLGRLGRPLDRRSPFFVGMAGAAGVAVTYVLAQLVLGTRDVLVLIGLAFFLAVGLEPAVSWLARHAWPRAAAVATVLATLVAVFVGFLVMAITPLVDQATQFASRAPEYLTELTSKGSWVSELDERFDLRDRVQKLLSTNQDTLMNGILGAGRMVFGVLTNTVIVLILTAYFLGYLPAIRRTMYRFVPSSRRPRAILIGDQMFARIGGYVLGNVLISLIAGGVTFIWLIVFGIPYALLLAIAVMILDLIPAVGATIAAVVVSLIALTVSLPVGIATAIFFIVYQTVENYLLAPKIMGRVVQVPDVVTVAAVLIGGTLLGVVGAIVAIPLAAAVLLLFREILFPRLDRA